MRTDLDANEQKIYLGVLSSKAVAGVRSRLGFELCRAEEDEAEGAR